MTKNQKITIGAVLVVSAGALIYSLATYKGHSVPVVEETASGPTINEFVIEEQTAMTPVPDTTGAPGGPVAPGTGTVGQGVPPSASATSTLAGTTGTAGAPGTLGTPGMPGTAGGVTAPGSVIAPAVPEVMPETPVAAAPTYKVKKGDTLHGIAKKELGSENKWKEILAANPSLDPKRLKIGMSLQMPAKAGAGTTASAAGTGLTGTGATGSPGFTPVSNTASSSTSAPKAKPVAASSKPASAPSTKLSTRNGVSIYTVRDGDTLRSISKEVYRGDEAKWESVFRLNRDVIGSDPGRLEAGTILILPASGK